MRVQRRYILVVTTRAYEIMIIVDGDEEDAKVDEIVQSESKLDLSNIPAEIKKHLFQNNSFRVRYFVE